MGLDAMVPKSAEASPSPTFFIYKISTELSQSADGKYLEQAEMVSSLAFSN